MEVIENMSAYVFPEGQHFESYEPSVQRKTARRKDEEEEPRVDRYIDIPQRVLDW